MPLAFGLTLHTMNPEQANRLSSEELKEFFDRLFPAGFAAPDVLAEIAPEGWEKSPLVACFHPTVEQLFEEQLRTHHNIEALRRLNWEHKPNTPEPMPRPEPTLEEVRADWQETEVNVAEEVTHLVGLCLWEVFSGSNHVFDAAGRRVDLGSLKAASALLDEYLWEDPLSGRTGDEERFYPGPATYALRVDLSPIYRMIFRRLKAVGADWEYQFPDIRLYDPSSVLRGLLGEPEEEPSSEPPSPELEEPGYYSPSHAFEQEQEAKRLEEEVEQAEAELVELEAECRRDMLDRAPPETVRAYEAIYGHDPKGWPPA